MSHHMGCSGTPALYYSVTGGPASTCGDLYTVRNGSLLTASGWLCTDASGNATKGPWTWAGTASDQTDTDTRIVWPNGTETTRDWHIWDKTCPSVSITSAAGTPPTAFSGSATDTTWGTGFRTNCSDSIYTSASSIYATYKDTTPGFNKYWSSSSGAYSSTLLVPIYGTLTGMPSNSVSWSASVPPAAAHTSGHSYEWGSCVTDCCCTSCVYRTFSVP